MNDKNLILIIGKNSATDNLTAALKEAGYFTKFADNFKDALDTLSNEKLDLMICFEAHSDSAFVKICRRLRSAFGKNLPPIFLIGAEISASKQAGIKLETGAIEYIETPFDSLKISERITNLLEIHLAKDLHRSEEKFKAQFKGTPIPTYIWKKLKNEEDLVLVDFNDAAAALTYSFPDNLGRKASDFFFDHPQILEVLFKCVNESKPIQFEAEYKSKITEETKKLDLHILCISSDLVMVQSRDITQTKEAEKDRAELVAQIESQRQRLNDIIESIPGVVWETQIAGNIADMKYGFVSDYIEKMTGYTPQEFLSAPDFWLKSIYPEDKERTIRKTYEFLKGRGESFMECRFIKKGGGIIWVETQMKIVKNDARDLIKLTGITIDVTERKLTEEALLKSETQLVQSQRLESVGRLAGGIAHDFNNMLTAINGYSELILRDLEAENPIYKKVFEIKKAGERSASLTQQLLAFSRKQLLRPQLIDLNHIVSDMSDLLNRLIGEHIRLKIKLNREECLVKADPGQLSQVIMNLAVNARDAMLKGGDLTIQTENVFLDEEYAAKHPPTIPGRYIRLAVSDTGTGLDKETEQYIFEPFYTTKEKSAGTGLGLATVYGIVKQSGGFIWIDSEKNKGATFNIYMPLVEGELNHPQEKNEFEVELFGDETILLVEDETAVLELTRKILTGYGYKIVEASDGIEALKIYKNSSEKIALLITDIVMPRMSGRELAEKILQANPNMRVLFSSGYTDDKFMMRGTEDKFMDYINKPFTSETLAHKVRQLLDKKRTLN